MKVDERGQSTVELALCLPIVVVVLGIVVQVGIVALDHVRVWHAAREGVRVAAVDPDAGAIRAAAESSGLKPLEVSVDPAELYRRQGEPVTVRVEYAPAGRMPLIGALFENLTVDAEATMRVEQP